MIYNVYDLDVQASCLYPKIYNYNYKMSELCIYLHLVRDVQNMLE